MAEDEGPSSGWAPVERTAETDTWRARLIGDDHSIASMRRMWRHVPHGPRCKVCAAPFEGIGGVATRLFQHGRSTANPAMCGMCFRHLADHPGGAEIDVSIVFADIRGSTGIAETIGPGAFREALQAFYLLAAKAIEDNGGSVDKYLGDGVMALFIPVIAGERHAERAVEAAVALVGAVERSSLPASGVRVGAGVHRGTAFVGVIGSGDRLDFSALGDPVNVAARLGALAGPGEVLASVDVWPSSVDERRRVEIAGRHDPLDVFVLRPARAGTTAS
ncbi:MAG TPA: adenylate/guanylate cyclase domain-containing protein [Candidatus Limnocylindrales bacterium]|nr:adenylate/guanylate cyclase domain-containing protein [Candidatus Limnocylindrales bacterium]